MGLPPLSGCLWDDPPQLWKNSVMIVVEEMEERRSPSSKLHVFTLVSCVILFSKAGHIQVTWWSLICYINTDLHNPQSARINFVQLNACGDNSCDDIGVGQGELSRCSLLHVASRPHSATLQSLTAPCDLSKGLHMSKLQNAVVIPAASPIFIMSVLQQRGLAVPYLHIKMERGSLEGEASGRERKRERGTHVRRPYRHMKKAVTCSASNNSTWHSAPQAEVKASSINSKSEKLFSGSAECDLSTAP
ncbi:hypothetical protein Q8A73_014648 [Channa argus]|nr:hypothetical protein Q8A73_014648 [Channa argus]